MNREKILELILEKIPWRSIIIMVVDITNFEGSVIEELFENINKNKHRLILVVNKIDALPRGFTVTRLQKWVKDQIRSKLSD